MYDVFVSAIVQKKIVRYYGYVVNGLKRLKYIG